MADLSSSDDNAPTQSSGAAKAKGGNKADVNSSDEEVKTADELLKKPDITEEFASFMSDFWDQYDQDGNGQLDKNEFFKFVEDVYFDDDMDASQRVDDAKF